MSDNVKKRGRLFVYSGSSGVGKGTIMQRILEADPNLRLSVSDTTRARRTGEIAGVHYNYVSREEFDRKVAQDGFLEHAEYCGNCYGTPKAQVESMLSEGYDVLLEIEVQGGLNIMNKVSDCVSIFILPPDVETLERRLRKRGTETEAQIKRRLETAMYEISFANKYEYNVVNGDLDKAVEDVLAIIHKETGRE